MSEGTLKATRLCKSYGKKDVLRGLDLELLPGCIYGLIGRNGAGKTTLLSILTAQNTWDEGEVTLNGEPVWENRHALDQPCFARELSPALKTGGADALRVKDYLRAACAAEAASWQRAHWQGAEVKAMLRASRSGCYMALLSEEQTELFRDAAQPLYEHLSETQKEVVRRVRALSDEPD